MIGTPRIAGQTHVGRGVRYQPSAETTAYREFNQQLLRDKFTPSDNPARDLVETMQSPQVSALPQGGLQSFEWLRSQSPVPVRTTAIPHLMEEGVNGAVYQTTNGREVWVHPDQTPMEKTNALAHELGHIERQHADRNVPYDIAEAEAETIAYGIMNRLHPWTNARQASAQYLQSAAPASSNYLQQNDVQQNLKAAIIKLMPEPRPPFAQILPAIYQ